MSTSADPLGSYYRYEFLRPLFPDYPRPAVWPDGYYVPTSTGDAVVQKHACVVDRRRMLAGEPVTEQCFVVDDVNFLNNADLDGQRTPPDGAPNVVMATGGTQLRGDFDDDAIYAWQLHVDRETPAGSRLSGPQRIPVAPYRYYRWLPSPAIDAAGNIGIGYSFGGTPHFPGQRFAGRLADDPPGRLTLREAVLVDGEAAQTNTLRWQDYT